LSLLALPVAASAEKSQWDVTVGVATLAVKLPWKDSDTQVAMAPYVDANYGNWHFGVENLVRYEYPFGKKMSVFTGLIYQDQGYDSSTSLFSDYSAHQVFNDYSSPKGFFMATAGMRWQGLSLTVAQDVSDRAKASTASAALNFSLWDFGRGRQIKLKASLDWYNEDYVNYYYGIAPEQANLAVGRQEYQGTSATNYQLGLEAIYPFNRHWALVISASRTMLDDSIVDSPLVGADYLDSLEVVRAYRF
ncbi:MAG: MipA/OmpV family protein, partial [Psychrosphaera sp.]|nr:MipA/OmpV family protein [Psychrosphaera sp.]